MNAERTKRIQVRDARDRLIEWLGLGEPFPLRDLPVPVAGLTVPFGQPAKIPVELSQPGVTYELHDNRERPMERSSNGSTEPINEKGTGQTIHLQTPAIADDVTYKILAKKNRSSRKTYLHEFATVKVGLDTALNAWIRSHPPLDPAIDTPAPTDARLANYGDPVEVEIELSQEGVDYRLVHFVADGGDDPKEIEISIEDVRGTSGNIVLHSQKMLDDTVLRVRTMKEFESSEGRENESQLLDIQLPLKVKANRALDVGLSPGPIVEFRTDASVRILATQASAQYRVHLHRIEDPEYVHDPAADEKVVRVREAGEPEVQVQRPELPEPWSAVEGFEQHGGYSNGNGGELQIQVQRAADDCMLIVEAKKIHALDENSSIPSSVWLLQPAALLRRPDPSPSLSLSVTMKRAKTDGLMRVSGGQPGVYYHFRTADDGPEIQRPAYFHKRDAQDSQFNQGLSQLEVEVDLAVAADPAPGSVGQSLDPARRSPEPPSLDTGPLAVDTLLHVRAVKAQSGIQTLLKRTAQVVGLPTIRPETPAVAQGSTAKVLIEASHEVESYQLARNGQGIGPALAGNGQDLALETDSIVADTAFEVWVTRPGDPGIPLLQSVPVTVWTLPDATLAVSASASEVGRGGTATVRVHSSQLGVFYQLVLAATPIGRATAGTGSNLALRTGSIETDSTFAVRATKANNRAVFVDLEQAVTISVRPEA